ncbi:MAG: GIY-YIG nuclease family protein [Rhizobiales bacterium]|nr:GIY-YIG nuclease family protein [Hyphomicrobiales bacterium]
MKFVYILRSAGAGDHYYVGVTGDVEDRLKRHNSGAVPHTAKWAPWRLKTYIAFSDESRAIAFERYLKSGSGRAFARKRL